MKVNNKILMSWEEFENRVKKMAEEIKPLLYTGSIKHIYGVPRGGLVIAVKLSHILDLPLSTRKVDAETLVVDDCYDSGHTKEGFEMAGVEHFFVLVDKKKEGIKEWLVFPWETTNE